MKKLQLLSTIFISIIILSTTSCKKGENDPSFSLKTRKARVTAEWKLTSGQILLETIDGSEYSSSEITYDGSTTTYGTTSTLYSEILKIERDGTFTKIITEGETESSKITTTTTGVWYFISGSKAQDYKNKERVAFETLTTKTESEGQTTSETFTGTQEASIMVLDKLTRTEIIMKIDNSFDNNQTGENKYRETYTGTLTYSKQ